jgi:arylsulfatase A-like enzyme
MSSFDHARRFARGLRAGAPLLTALVLSACGGGDDADTGFSVIRLQDVFDDAAITGSSGAVPEIAPTEIRFDGTPGVEWDAARGLAALEVENGRLIGTTGDIVPFVHVEHAGEIDSRDSLHSIEIRGRVSVDTRFGISLSPQAPSNYDAMIARMQTQPWPLVQEVTAADEIQTYTFLAEQQGRVPAPSARHILIRPADEAGAEFEIESIRLTFLREHLASIPSGIGWRGLAGVFHETVITRSPERASFELTLPEDPWLDLSVGTLEQSPVTFRVAVSHEGHELVLGERTVTEPQIWQAMPIDLSEFGGETITLALELDADSDNALGFWGSPAVRSRLVAQAAAGDAPRGVILFVADTLRRDNLSTYGYERETSPVLTRLAGEGALVLDAQAHAIWTKVSVPSIHTSLYPRTHTVQRFFDLLPPTATTLAEVYREAGFATFSLTSNAFVGRATNLHQGFEEVHEPASLPGAGFSKSARPFVDRVIPWLEAHRDGPFFINIHVTDPHSPYPGYEPYNTMWGDEASRAAYQDIQDRLRQAGGGGFGGGPNGEPKTGTFEAAGIEPGPYVEQEINWYDGSIRAMDAEIGRLVETIERLGLGEDILFAFISDHGEEFLEHGSHFHLQIYGPNSNVPLVLWAPGRIEAGTVIGDPLQSIDLMPTLLDLSGLGVPDAAQGQSFESLLQPPQLASGGVAYAQSAWRPVPVFTEQLRDDNGTEPGPFPRDAYAVIEGGWKLVHNVHIPEGMDYPEYELFDHANDPLDQLDLAAGNPEVVVRLSRLIDDWLAYALAEQLPAVQTTLEALDPAELRRLCALGYIACP